VEENYMEGESIKSNVLLINILSALYALGEALYPEEILRATLSHTFLSRGR